MYDFENFNNFTNFGMHCELKLANFESFKPLLCGNWATLVDLRLDPYLSSQGVVFSKAFFTSSILRH